MTVRDLMLVTHNEPKVEVAVLRDSSVHEEGFAYEYTGTYSWSGECTADRNLVDFLYGNLEVIEIFIVGNSLRVFADGREVE